MNGDDGYVDGGGGGSVWWETSVSEGELYSTQLVNLNGHTARKDGHTAYRLRGYDSFTERKNGKKADPRGDGYIVVTITDVNDIKRIEFVGSALRLFLPIDGRGRDEPRVRQFSVRWGLRKVAQRVFNWERVRAALIDLGAVQTSDGGDEVTREVGSASAGRR
jgi:hypothetical protein